jgi:flagellin
MGLRISTNLASMSAQRALNESGTNQKTNYERLASGKRITSAGDDAAGLSISDNLRGQIRSMNQAERNANDGISFVQVAEGGLTEVANIVIRLRELSIQAASETVGDRERGFLNQEVQSLKEEVDRIASVTNFNNTPLISGQGKALDIQVGIRNDETDRIQFKIKDNDVRSKSIGISAVDISSVKGARNAIDRLDEALGNVNSSRARLGAMQNKLHSTTRNLAISKENLSEARSRIADADVAQVTSDLVRDNILSTAGTSVLAQANAAPQKALSLL